MPYRTWATNDVPTAADFNAMFADASTADVATTQTTASSSYTDLATTGPAVTFTLVSGQQALIHICAKVFNDADNATQSGVASFALTGSTSVSAADSNSIEHARTDAATCARITIVTAGASGSHTATMKYKRVGGGNGSFTDRRIVAKKY